MRDFHDDDDVIFFRKPYCPDENSLSTLQQRMRYKVIEENMLSQTSNTWSESGEYEYFFNLDNAVMSILMPSFP